MSAALVAMSVAKAPDTLDKAVVCAESTELI